jgi:hypothetical protein
MVCLPMVSPSFLSRCDESSLAAWETIELGLGEGDVYYNIPSPGTQHVVAHYLSYISLMQGRLIYFI